MSDLTVTIIDSNEELHKLAPEWSDLLDASPSGSVFLTWEWLSAWAECFLVQNRSLFILAFHEDGIIVGIAPFYIENEKCGPFPLRTIRLLGAPEAGSDYLNIFAREGWEKAVADAFYDFLMGDGRRRWDVVHLQNIPSDALFCCISIIECNSMGNLLK